MIRRTLRFAAIMALALSGEVALAAPSQSISWSDLPDPAFQVFEDPYRDLNPEQFDDVLFVVRMRGRLDTDIGSPEERQKWRDLLDETTAALAADGIDIDWLLDQRQVVTERRTKAATQGNPQFDGETVTLAGFAIPAPPDADGRSVAYLVPERGMCSHMPPPAPNQMVRLRLSGDWTPGYVHEYVRLTGRLTIDPTDQKMLVVDGIMPMRATFKLDVVSAETLGTQNEQLNRTQSVADRIRAAGDRKSGGARGSD